MSTSDSDPGDAHTYTLVSGDGDTDNSSFTIEGDQLKIIESPDFETKSSYFIRLKTKDFGGLTFEKSFDLEVNDLEVNIAVQSDLSGRQGNLVSIPIQINDASGVEAIDLNIAYDQNIFDVPTSGIFEPGELNPDGRSSLTFGTWGCVSPHLATQNWVPNMDQLQNLTCS